MSRAALRPALALALMSLAACGGTAPAATSSATSPATTTPSASAPSTSTTTGCGTALQITVKGSTVTPPPGTTDVKAGCEVDLTVTSDRTSEVHIHVVELEKPITAGQPLRVTFTPTQTGVYEVELHDPDLLLVKLAVR